MTAGLFPLRHCGIIYTKVKDLLEDLLHPNLKWRKFGDAFVSD